MSLKKPDFKTVKIKLLTGYLRTQVAIIKGKLLGMGKEIVLQLNEDLYNWLYAEYEAELNVLKKEVTVVSSKFCLFPPIRIHVLGNNMNANEVTSTEIELEVTETPVSDKVVDIGFDKLKLDGMI